jgi:hypothetical protein
MLEPTNRLEKGGHVADITIAICEEDIVLFKVALALEAEYASSHGRKDEAERLIEYLHVIEEEEKR